MGGIRAYTPPYTHTGRLWEAYTPPYVHTQGGYGRPIHHHMYTPREAREAYTTLYTPGEAREAYIPPYIHPGRLE